MLYLFKSPVTSEVLMTSACAAELLHLIGKAITPQGIVIEDDLPGAILALERAIRTQEAAGEAGARAESADPDSAPDGGPDDEAVSLRLRAWPLLEQMRQSVQAQVPVVWDTRSLPSARPLKIAGYA